jgi:DNA-binding NarL/FixJ family response regulator
MDKIKILLVDDHAMFRDGLRALLNKEEDMQVVGEASNGQEAILKSKSQQPDIVVMDITMPGVNGLNASERIIREEPSIKVIILSMWLDEELVKQAANIGVSGYIVKQTAASELISAIREVQKGNAFFSPPISKILMKFQNRSQSNKRPELSYREQEVLQLLTEGKSCKEISEMLLVSVKTVEKYRQQIMNKYDIHDSVSLTRYAITHKLVK